VHPPTQPAGADYTKAVLDMYRQAAASGSAEAQYNLGVMYSHGQGNFTNNHGAFSGSKLFWAYDFFLPENPIFFSAQKGPEKAHFVPCAVCRNFVLTL
jgi:hypothetical protein